MQQQHLILPTTAYSFWSVRLHSGEERFEVDGLDWSRAMVQTGDIHRIAELRLHCPLNRIATLKITHPETAFQLKRASVIQGIGHMRTAHIIGRIDNPATGACTAHIWDTFTGFVEEFHTYFHDFGPWRIGVDVPGALSRAAQGMAEA